MARLLESLQTILAPAGLALIVQEDSVPDGSISAPVGESAVAATVGGTDGPALGGDVATVDRPPTNVADDELVADLTTEHAVERSESAILGYFSHAGGGQRARLLLRPKDGGARRQRASEMASHVRRAIQIHRNLAGQRAESMAAQSTLDFLPIGVLVVNNVGRVLQTNRHARAVIELRDGLSVDRTGLCAAVPKETGRLRRIIAQVAAAGRQAARTPVGVMRIDRPSLAAPWLTMVLPVDGGAKVDGIAQLAAVFVSDGETQPDIPGEVLERLFDLTPAEARLLVALVRGQSLDEAAQAFTLSKNTLRNQLNQIFRKTGTAKQSELVRTVLISPAPVMISLSQENNGNT